MVMGALKRDQWAAAKVFASQPGGNAVIESFQQLSEQQVRRKSELKAVVSILNRLISVRPLEVSPNQIVLVGRSPAHIVPFGHT